MSIPVVSRIGYVPALDGIRGILIIAVIGVHYFGYPIGADTSMDVFFALSGFLITTLLLEERDRKDRVSLPGFYRRRAYRLLPALFTVLGAYVIVTQASPRGLEQTAAGGFYAANIVMASGSHLLDGTPMLVYWSLAQEEQFYLLWPLLLVLLLKRGVRESRIAKALVGLVIVLAIYRAMLAVGGATASRIYLGPDTHADGLILGCVLAFVRRQGLRVPQFAGWLGLGALFATYAFVSPTLGPIAYGLLPMSIAATLLVGAAIEPGVLSRCLSFRPLAWLGVMSYSLYVWHLFVFWLFGWQRPLLALPVALVVGALSYYKIEKPLRTAFRSRRTPAAETQSAPALSSEAPRRTPRIPSVLEPNDAALHANG